MYCRSRQSMAKKAALQFLSHRDHGHYELQQKLLNNGFELIDIDEAMIFCRNHHYLDDLRYAKTQMKRQINNGHGEGRIRQELQAKRVSNEVIEQVLREQPQDWFKLARYSLEQNFDESVVLGEDGYTKQVRYLQFRGFSFDQIEYALNPG
ncbi:recombination regulator RecX [Vibrio sp. UCD-FRSSP16_10]|uniref:recombination regulator RecX n=1 Tax=unclassified Vibrio TaxID=2614977 RepID=UPI0007FC8B83|nr:MULTISPECIES: recombination regulator RecX [unclassified Vibrio]OBT17322.1 recombination regulator RecX [Vibrio sp. UCD-FRSSP16_30]OBT23091.1 recombination regulator RecX [Vibrio sp. UCD-FRSSP16_10]